jgi:hypothetical protein
MLILTDVRDVLFIRTYYTRTWITGKVFIKDPTL